MFSLRNLRFVHLISTYYVRKGLWVITHKSTRSENTITWFAAQDAGHIIIIINIIN